MTKNNERVDPIPPSGRSNRSLHGSKAKPSKKNLYVAGGQGRDGHDVDFAAKGFTALVAMVLIMLGAYIVYSFVN